MESEAGEDAAGLELARYLARRFTYLDEAGWAAQAAAGRIAVDGKPAEAGLVLEPGRRIAFDPGELREPDVDLRYRVVLDRPGFLVLDKSADLPVHPAGRYFRNTLWFEAGKRFGPLRFATRLDRETSGLVLACRSAEAARRMQALDAEGRLGKSYLALVHGDFPDEPRCVLASGFLVKDEGSAVRKKRRFVPAGDPRETGAEGREAGADGESCATELRLVSKAGDLSLVEARLLTGRTHQIRATLLALGFPVVGDKLYGRDEGLFLRFAEGALSDGDREVLQLGSQALHAWRLDLEDGEDGFAVRSPPPWKAYAESRGIDFRGLDFQET